jgi:hypothetical protein
VKNEGMAEGCADNAVPSGSVVKNSASGCPLGWLRFITFRREIRRRVGNIGRHWSLVIVSDLLSS